MSACLRHLLCTKNARAREKRARVHETHVWPRHVNFNSLHFIGLYKDGFVNVCVLMQEAKGRVSWFLPSFCKIMATTAVKNGVVK